MNQHPSRNSGEERKNAGAGLGYSPGIRRDIGTEPPQKSSVHELV